MYKPAASYARGTAFYHFLFFLFLRSLQRRAVFISARLLDYKPAAFYFISKCLSAYRGPPSRPALARSAASGREPWQHMSHRSSYGLYSYGVYSFGLCSYALQADAAFGREHWQHVGRGQIVSGTPTAILPV